MSRIGFIGTGHIAAPMARAVARDGHAVLVSDRNAEIAQSLSRDPAISVAPNQQVLDGSDIVFLCLRPQIAPDILAGLRFRADQQIVSVMAGVAMARLQALCAPATDFTMTIPMGFLEQGGCPLAAYPGAGPLDGLFGAKNPVIPVTSEAALAQHFAVAALVPGMLDLLAHGVDWLSARTGDGVGAERYVTQMMAGFLAALPDDGQGHLARERDALATQGSLSLMMVDGLRRADMPSALRAAMDDIGTRMERTS